MAPKDANGKDLPEGLTPSPDDYFYYDPAHPPTWLDQALYGLWRFDKTLYCRIPSRILCFLGYHVWLVYDGRPLNCGKCGKPGHPLAMRDLSKKIEQLGRPDNERPADQRLE